MSVDARPWDEAALAGEVDAERLRLLLAVLNNVPFDGWSNSAIEAGAREAEIDVATLLHLAPNGAADMVAAFSRWADQRMLEALAQEDIRSLRVRERVALAVNLRFQALEGLQEQVRRATTFLLIPRFSGLGGKLIAETVDSVWYGIGDQSSDINWYTKRALLAGVITTSVLFWLNDSSQDRSDTTAFVHRRIDEVLRVGRFLGRPQAAINLAAFLPSPARFLRSLSEHMAERR